jgi:hypothetical protein
LKPVSRSGVQASVEFKPSNTQSEAALTKNTPWVGAALGAGVGDRNNVVGFRVGGTVGSGVGNGEEGDRVGTGFGKGVGMGKVEEMVVH